MEFQTVTLTDERAIAELSQMASEIVKEHFDPIIGAAQNDYMIERFQSVPAIRRQLESEYQYYFVCRDSERIGFLAFYPRENAMYLSKFYLYRSKRGNGYSRQMLDFVIQAAKKEGLSSIELNVNRNNSAIYAYEKLGFKILRTEKNDIGNGFYMDDYVYQLIF